MNNGWIKLHRKLLEWEWYDEPNTFRLFIHLLIKANNQPKSYRGININSGQIMTGQDVLAMELKLTRNKIRVALNNLKTTNEITIKSSRQGSIIQIVKYKDYQITTAKTPTETPSNHHPITTNKKHKETKEEIKPDLVEFMNYAKEKCQTEDEYKQLRNNLKLKYDAWSENDWHDGYDKKIKRWKPKVCNLIPHLRK